MVFFFHRCAPEFFLREVFFQDFFGRIFFGMWCFFLFRKFAALKCCANSSEFSKSAQLTQGATSTKALRIAAPSFKDCCSELSHQYSAVAGPTDITNKYVYICIYIIYTYMCVCVCVFVCVCIYTYAYTHIGAARVLRVRAASKRRTGGRREEG